MFCNRWPWLWARSCSHSPHWKYSSSGRSGKVALPKTVLLWTLEQVTEAFNNSRCVVLRNGSWQFITTSVLYQVSCVYLVFLGFHSQVQLQLWPKVSLSISLLFQLDLLSCIYCFEIAKLFLPGVFFKLANSGKWVYFHTWIGASINDSLFKLFLNTSTIR